MNKTTRSSEPMTPPPASIRTSPEHPRHTLRIRSSAHRSGNLLIDLPIGTRLTLGFIAAAVIAALMSGIIGFQHAQSVSDQSTFYAHLLSNNTHLTTTVQDLQLIKTETQDINTLLGSPSYSTETLKTDRTALNGLISRVDNLLSSYFAHDVLTKNPNEEAIIKTAGKDTLIQQQDILIASTTRTWNTHKQALQQINTDYDNNQLTEAQTLEQAQVEPTSADTLSAIQSLIQFNSQLANTIGLADSAQVSQEIIATIISAIVAFLLIMLIGWSISKTIIQRLGDLRRVTKSVEQGQLDRRVAVIGRDEIADVASSVNAMLEAIVGLLEETRNQRDVLTNAAEHLFSDMRVVSAGDLRINAPVSNDPIGMLANAFNFTVGRFRRFLQRSRTSAERLDVFAHQQVERSEAFTQSLSQFKGGMSSIRNNSKPLSNVGKATSNMSLPPLENHETRPTILINQVQQTRQQLQQYVKAMKAQHTQTQIAHNEQIMTTLERLNALPETINILNMRSGEFYRHFHEEVKTLETLIRRAFNEQTAGQKNTFKNFQDLDQELLQISTTIRNIKLVDNDQQVSGITGTTQELIKYSTNFANDMHTMAQQLTALAQEMRTGIISFQLDTPENVNSREEKTFNAH